MDIYESISALYQNIEDEDIDKVKSSLDYILDPSFSNYKNKNYFEDNCYLTFMGKIIESRIAIPVLSHLLEFYTFSSDEFIGFFLILPSYRHHFDISIIEELFCSYKLSHHYISFEKYQPSHLLLLIKNILSHRDSYTFFQKHNIMFQFDKEQMIEILMTVFENSISLKGYEQYNLDFFNQLFANQPLFPICAIHVMVKYNALKPTPLEDNYYNIFASLNSSLQQKIIDELNIYNSFNPSLEKFEKSAQTKEKAIFIKQKLLKLQLYKQLQDEAVDINKYKILHKI